MQCPFQALMFFPNKFKLYNFIYKKLQHSKQQFIFLDQSLQVPLIHQSFINSYQMTQHQTQEFDFLDIDDIQKSQHIQPIPQDQTQVKQPGLREVSNEPLRFQQQIQEQSKKDIADIINRSNPGESTMPPQPQSEPIINKRSEPRRLIRRPIKESGSSNNNNSNAQSNANNQSNSINQSSANQEQQSNASQQAHSNHQQVAQTSNMSQQAPNLNRQQQLKFLDDLNTNIDLTASIPMMSSPTNQIRTNPVSPHEQFISREPMQTKPQLHHGPQFLFHRVQLKPQVMNSGINNVSSELFESSLPDSKDQKNNKMTESITKPLHILSENQSLTNNSALQPLKNNHSDVNASSILDFNPSLIPSIPPEQPQNLLNSQIQPINQSNNNISSSQPENIISSQPQSIIGQQVQIIDPIKQVEPIQELQRNILSQQGQKSISKLIQPTGPSEKPVINPTASFILSGTQHTAQPLQEQNIVGRTIQHILQPNQQPNTLPIALPHLSCSIIELSELQSRIQSNLQTIAYFTSPFKNPLWKSSKYHPHSLYSHVSLLTYYGHSSQEIQSNDMTLDNKPPGLSRDMIFGSKSKLKRQVLKETQAQKALTQKKSHFLYTQPNILPLTEDSLQMFPYNQPNLPLCKFSFNKKLNIVIDLLQLLVLIHSQSFILFPNVLFGNSNFNPVLFHELNAHNKSTQTSFYKFLLGIHPFESLYKYFDANQTFNLKGFINKALFKINFTEQQSQTQAKKQIKPSEPNLNNFKHFKSPEIRFYFQPWYWELFDKNLKSYAQSQNAKISDVINSHWIDLFEISLALLQFIFGQDIISKLIETKYDQLNKAIAKIIKEKAKKPTVQSSKEKENAAKLLTQVLNQTILNPQTQDQITKLCFKPLLQWKDYENLYRQLQQKHQKTTANKLKPKNEKEQSIVAYPEAKKLFDMVAGLLTIIPFHQVSKEKWERKRLASLKDLFQKLKKFKTPDRNHSFREFIERLKKTLPKPDQGLEKKQELLSQEPISQSLTVLSQDHQTLNQLRQKYHALMHQSLQEKRYTFTNQVLIQHQLHLLTPQIKKKLSTVFSSHNGIMKSPKNFNLVFKGSTFCFSAKMFYECCDKKGHLLYVIKPRMDRTLYCYNQEKISSFKQTNGLFGGFVKDTKATSFIYTGDQVLKVKNPSKSFGVSRIYGPVIGQGDIIIKDGNLDNQCNHPVSYEATTKTKRLLKQNRFILQELEVYEITF